MQIFALETNIGRVKEHFLAHGEAEIFTAHPHVFSFLWHIAWEVFVTALLVLLSGYAYEAGILSAGVAIGVFATGWFIFVFFGLVEAYIDWKYDFIFLTTDKLIIVDQMSLFRKSITPISLENLGDVVAETQWLNLFRFGIIRFALKEGQGPEVVLRFMPRAEKLVGHIAEQITLYQRRKDYVVPYRSRDSVE
jgi:hypothetical protein